MLRHMMLRVKVISRIALRFDAARKDDMSRSEEDGTIHRFYITSDLVATIHHTISYGARDTIQCIVTIDIQAVQ